MAFSNFTQTNGWGIRSSLCQRYLTTKMLTQLCQPGKGVWSMGKARKFPWKQPGFSLKIRFKASMWRFFCLTYVNRICTTVFFWKKKTSKRYGIDFAYLQYFFFSTHFGWFYESKAILKPKSLWSARLRIASGNSSTLVTVISMAGIFPVKTNDLLDNISPHQKKNSCVTWSSWSS